MFPRNPQLTVKQGGGTHGEHLYILLLNNNPTPPDHFTPPSNMVFFSSYRIQQQPETLSFSFYFFLYLFTPQSYLFLFLYATFYYTFFSEIIPHNPLKLSQHLSSFILQLIPAVPSSSLSILQYILLAK